MLTFRRDRRRRLSLFSGAKRKRMDRTSWTLPEVGGKAKMVKTDTVLAAGLVEECEVHAGRSSRTCVECDREKIVSVWRRSAIRADQKRFGSGMSNIYRPTTPYLKGLLNGMKRCVYCLRTVVYCNNPIHPLRATLDRVHSHLPHSNENVTIACYECNRKKGSDYWEPLITPIIDFPIGVWCFVGEKPTYVYEVEMLYKAGWSELDGEVADTMGDVDTWMKWDAYDKRVAC